MASRREQFEALLRESPEDAELRYAVAMEYVAEGALEQGLAALRALNAILPDYIPAYVQAGQLLAKLGREDEAREVFQAGIARARATSDHHAADEMTAFLDSLG